MFETNLFLSIKLIKTNDGVCNDMRKITSVIL